MKRIYRKPEMEMHTASLADVMLIGASDGNNGVIPGGGGTGSGGVTEGGAKRRRGIFDEDVEDERESIIW